VRFLIDKCAGRKLAEWLRENGHDVSESRKRGEDPGDSVILDWAANEKRILITMDKDFGELIFSRGKTHFGLVRLPDVPVRRRIELMKKLLHEYEEALESKAVITVRSGRIRISREGDPI
jgi:predicted nuclease of predicted toxin-antitoxin system